MAHPFFDRQAFPFWREDAVAFLQSLSSTYTDVKVIKALYEDSGGDLSRLRIDLEPYYVWRQVLRLLTKERALGKLCEILLTKREKPTTGAAVQAVIDAGVEIGPARERAQLLEPSPPNAEANFLRSVFNWGEAVRSMTIFVSPYAAYDVDGTGDPRQLARALVEKSLAELKRDLGPVDEVSDFGSFDSDMMSNLLVATSTSFAMSTNYEGLWRRLCDIPGADSNRSKLFAELADLALAWQERIKHQPSELWYEGLVFVTFDMNSRLESELADAGIDFGVLNVLADGRFSYHRNIGRLPDQGLRFEKLWSHPDDGAEASGGDGVVRSQVGTARFNIGQPVVVVKLMGFTQLSDLRPLLGLEILSLLRGRESLPVTLKKHLERSPFVMLGGGLLDPFVALAFEAHFKNALAVTAASTETVPRFVVLHPSPASDDMLRLIECQINRLEMGWTERTYGLKLLVSDLPAIVSKMSDKILDQIAVRSAA